VESGSGICGISATELHDLVSSQRTIPAAGELCEKFVYAVRSSRSDTPNTDDPVVLEKFHVGVGHEAIALTDRLRDRDLTFRSNMHIHSLILTDASKNWAVARTERG
jgi:hypothetical protein